MESVHLSLIVTYCYLMLPTLLLLAVVCCYLLLLIVTYCYLILLSTAYFSNYVSYDNKNSLQSSFFWRCQDCWNARPKYVKQSSPLFWTSNPVVWPLTNIWTVTCLTYLTCTSARPHFMEPRCLAAYMATRGNPFSAFFLYYLYIRMQMNLVWWKQINEMNWNEMSKLNKEIK